MAKPDWMLTMEEEEREEREIQREREEDADYDDRDRPNWYNNDDDFSHKITFCLLTMAVVNRHFSFSPKPSSAHASIGRHRLGKYTGPRCS